MPKESENKPAPSTEDWSFDEKDHRKFESDPVHDPYPERRYDAETQKRMKDRIEEDKKFLRELSRREAGKGGNYVPDDPEPPE